MNGPLRTAAAAMRTCLLQFAIVIVLLAAATADPALPAEPVIYLQTLIGGAA